MKTPDHRLSLPCADTVGDSVHFTPLTDSYEGRVAVTAIEDGAHVVVHLTPEAQRRLQAWLAALPSSPRCTHFHRDVEIESCYGPPAGSSTTENGDARG
jgi:hypothetical protein